MRMSMLVGRDGILAIHGIRTQMPRSVVADIAKLCHEIGSPIASLLQEDIPFDLRFSQSSTIYYYVQQYVYKLLL